MRDRLIELRRKAWVEWQQSATEVDFEEYCADHLIANGVIVPPVKVGDMVYVLETFPNSDKCESCEYFYEGGMGDSPSCEKTRCGDRAAECIEITELILTEKLLHWWLYMNAFGKTVFLSKEEAEAALKGGAE